MPQHLEGEGLGQGHQGRDGARKGFPVHDSARLMPGAAMLVVFSVACASGMWGHSENRACVGGRQESPRTQCPRGQCIAEAFLLTVSSLGGPS